MTQNKEKKIISLLDGINNFQKHKKKTKKNKTF